MQNSFCLAPTHPALYATRSAGKPLVVPADIDHALAYMFSFSCGKKVMEPETLQRGNEWLIGMLEANAVELPAGCNWLESGVVPKDWWERFFKRHPHLEEGKARSVEEARVVAHSEASLLARGRCQFAGRIDQDPHRHIS